jgi:uncharacterized protein (DUF2237 family)
VLLCLVSLKNGYPHKAVHMVTRVLGKEFYNEKKSKINKCSTPMTPHWTANQVITDYTWCWRRMKEKKDTYRRVSVTYVRCKKHRHV